MQIHTSGGRGSRLALILALLAAAYLFGVPSADAAPANPSQDPFYSYSGSLSGVANGTILRSRVVTFDDQGLPVPVSTTQVLFRSTSELGSPIVAVSTIVAPLRGATGKIVSYQWAYDGMAPNCEPSYAIQGGTPTESTNPDEQALMAPLLAAGETVITTDYESEDDDFAAGREEGQITLDGIRAAETELQLPASTPVALMGYSGGAIASDWAAELAPTYAPELDLVADAEGGIAVDLAHNLAYVNGSQEWSGAIPAALVGIARAFKIDLSTYLSSYGMKVADAVGGTCLETDLGAYPGLTYQQLLKPQYTNIDQIPAFVNAINTLIMGTGGTPRAPMFMGVGDADGTGDDVMVDADDEALAHLYCQEGLPVQFTVYQNDNHGDAADDFLPSAESWVIGRLAGTPPDNGCASIPAGDSLAPLKAASAASTSSGTRSATGRTIAASLHLQYRRRAGRVVHLRLRAVHAAVKNVTISLINARGRVLAHRRLSAARGRLIAMTLTAHRRLAPGTYRIVATVGRHRLASVRFRVKRT